jgi:hypothetical protein
MIITVCATNPNPQNLIGLHLELPPNHLWHLKTVPLLQHRPKLNRSSQRHTKHQHATHTNHTLKRLIQPSRDKSNRNQNKIQTQKQKTNPKRTQQNLRRIPPKKRERKTGTERNKSALGSILDRVRHVPYQLS